MRQTMNNVDDSRPRLSVGISGNYYQKLNSLDNNLNTNKFEERRMTIHNNAQTGINEQENDIFERSDAFQEGWPVSAVAKFPIKDTLLNNYNSS